MLGSGLSLYAYLTGMTFRVQRDGGVVWERVRVALQMSLGEDPVSRQTGSEGAGGIPLSSAGPVG